ncbi:molecular chaperone [Candidatus Endoriftia persephone str. Guaymas]|uniref:Respiratory nitrate reductase delta chain n=3 Tax=Gammaproteobacteria TaxID=1236 RepID=G2FE16_9GAMM|nr:nitrate reductase molybdenum cofactor assembly chaperone [Candidatus Endoriftia persephone]EGV52363.1 respiratory nitrate reductase delta chain [endosymbiont of Riftia pachyptila (vent Ph05)]EGW55000.1 respiratory nitrate reductase delta chain [endosymbiont of Tevnia jerichonana (vent Tica)]MBA1332409.1 molecular chaperone [Candidatus Endoriftia persephone str. Guaymas]USF87847.1 nitrate reductase molybdenum cofactor assembly chaperone [Candidatus Endoriftia persephone]
MRIYNIMARLLDYPTEELMENLPAIITILKEDPEVSAQEREDLMQLISWMQLHDLIGMQADYVQTFDMTPEHDLHLTHHLFGDDRGRGPALIDLSEHFKSAGLEVEEGEIPDYLPLILEYVSTLDEMQARVFLGDAAKVITVLAENLEKAESPYSRLLRIVEGRGHLAKAA